MKNTMTQSRESDGLRIGTLRWTNPRPTGGRHSVFTYVLDPSGQVAIGVRARVQFSHVGWEWTSYTVVDVIDATVKDVIANGEEIEDYWARVCRAQPEEWHRELDATIERTLDHVVECYVP